MTETDSAPASVPEVDCPSLLDVLNISIKVDIVDIGANAVDGNPPYKPLLERGAARVIGFEPNDDARARLDRAKGPNETYLPFAVGDGQRHTYHWCKAQGMNSLLKPNAAFLQYLHGFPEWAVVQRTSEVETVRLDDVAEVGSFDHLKIDIQGAELMVFENATERLKDCLVIQTEAEFVPMYVDQPLFSEVEQFLRRQGFMIHGFFPLETRCIQPMKRDDNIYAGLNQITWADAVFVRDFTRIDQFDDGQLLRMALILHDIYHSFDIVVRLLMEHDRRRATAFIPAYRAFAAMLAARPK